MEYRNVGRSGLKVSELCLGAMTFGHGTDQEQATHMVDLALSAGVNYFDTADEYGASQSEVMLGNALKGRRREVVLGTKVFSGMGPGPNDSGTSRVHIMNAIEDSLTRLQTDYIDIYFIHHVDVQTPLEEMLRALDDLVHQGKVRYIGCCNHEAWRLMEALWISDTRNLARFECYQGQYSLFVRDIELELIPLSQYKGVGVVAWSPLAGGFLSGKYKPGQDSAPGARTEDTSWHNLRRYFPPNTGDIIATLLQVAQEAKCSPAQAALRWVLDQPGITSAIVGARTAEQLRDNLGAADVRLDPVLLERLKEVSRLPTRYPQITAQGQVRRRTLWVNMPSLGESK